MLHSKIIVSSAAMLEYLAKIMEFLKDEAKLVVCDHELQIEGFRYLGVEPQKDFETVIAVQALRNLQKFLRSISDQPLTIAFSHSTIYVHSIII